MQEVCYTKEECLDPCKVKRVQRMAAKFKIPKEHWSSDVGERFQFLYNKVFDPKGSKYYGFREEFFHRKPRKKETQPRKPRKLLTHEDYDRRRRKLDFEPYQPTREEN